MCHNGATKEANIRVGMEAVLLSFTTTTQTPTWPASTWPRFSQTDMLVSANRMFNPPCGDSDPDHRRSAAS